jgi:hypothetical protein
MGVVIAKREVIQHVRTRELKMFINLNEVPHAKYKILYWAFDGFC